MSSSLLKTGISGSRFARLRAAGLSLVLAGAGLGVVALPAAADADPQLDGGDAYVEAATSGDLAALAADQTEGIVVDGETIDGLYEVDESLIGVDASEDDYARIEGGAVSDESPLTADELYGEAIDPSQLEQAAPLIVQQEMSVSDAEVGAIEVFDPTPVLDAFGVPIGMLWTYSSTGGGAGYIALATHTRAPLILAFSEDGEARLEGDLYFAGDGEIYAASSGGGAVGASTALSEHDFANLLEASRDAALGMDREYLAALEQQTKAQLNNVTGTVQTDWLDESVGSNTSYDGQDTDDAYANYGGIYGPVAYIKDRYGAETVTLTSSEILSVSKFLMSDYGPSGGGDCAPTSITRTFWYWRAQRDYLKIASDREKLYNRVIAIAKEWGFTQSSGTNPVNIDNIMSDVADYYGYDSTTKGIYVYSWSNTVKSEIDASRPLLLNMDQGTYADHTVTVNGYRTYKYVKSNGTTGTIKFLAVVDGWKAGQRYIDFNLMSGGTFRGTLASFNTMKLTK